MKSGSIKIRFVWLFVLTGISISAFSQWEHNDGCCTGKINSTISFKNQLFIYPSWDKMITIDENTWKWQVDSSAPAQLIVTVFAGNESGLFAGTSKKGILKFDTATHHWLTKTNGLPATVYIQDILLKDSVIFSGTMSNGVYKSTDEGENWTSCGSLPGNFVKTMSAIGTVVLAGQSNSVYASYNEGLSWSLLSSFPLFSTEFGHLNRIINSGSRLYACTSEGLYRSNDSAKTWLLLYGQMPPMDINDALISGDTLILATHNGLYLSVDGGSNCVPYNQFFRSKWINDLYSSGNHFYAVLSTGDIYRITDSSTYILLNKKLPAGDGINSLAGNENYLFAGLNKSGVYRTENYGLTWDSVNSGIPPYQSGLRISSLLTFKGKIYAATRRGIFLSDDDGISWKSSLVQHADNCVLGASENRIFAGNSDYGLYVSDDQGKNWTYFPAIGGNVRAIAARDSFLVLGTWHGMYYSEDEGHTWNKTGNPMGVSNVISAAIHGSHIFAGSGSPPQGVFVSDDKCLTWTEKGHENGDSTIKRMATYSNLVITGGSFRGIFITSDDGDSWLNINGNLPHSNAFLAGVYDGYAYASSDGLWKRKLSGLSGIEGYIKSPLSFQVYPNPAISNINIELPPGCPLNKIIEITDQSGRIIRQFASKESRIEIAVEDFPDGVYLIRLISDKLVATGKFIKN